MPRLWRWIFLLSTHRSRGGLITVAPVALAQGVVEIESHWTAKRREQLGVKEQSPFASAILADHMLKGETGVELAAKMKAIVPAVPIMMVSGTHPDSLRNIDCFLHKGEPVPIMLEMVRDLVKRRKS